MIVKFKKDSHNDFEYNLKVSDPRCYYVLISYTHPYFTNIVLSISYYFIVFPLNDLFN